MDTAWSVMWNVTDETPANSERFLDKSGMEVLNSFFNICSLILQRNKVFFFFSLIIQKIFCQGVPAV